MRVFTAMPVIVRDQVAGVVYASRTPSNVFKYLYEQRGKLVLAILRNMASSDREILTRFYLHEQPLQQICDEMHLTDTQFRLLKSRAKARFAEVGKKKLQRPILGIF